MSNVNHCPRCGTELLSNDPRGLCPSCLQQDEMKCGANMLLDCTVVGNLPTESYAGDKYRVGFAHNHESTLPEPGQQFGRYLLVRKLGQGGMGAVFEAVEQDSGRRVALKLLSHSLESEEARKRFLREGRLAAAVNHPNSVYIYGTEEINGTPVICMEQVACGSLLDRVRQQGPMPITEAVDAILQIIDGLEAAEAAGVLHRDIKPSNCFVDTDGTVKIGDFGLSISTTVRGETNLTNPGTVLGTPAFSSPEQLRGGQLDVRSDIYSVGVTLFYLLTGRTAHESDNMVNLLAIVLEKPAPSPVRFRPDVDTW